MKRKLNMIRSVACIRIRALSVSIILSCQFSMVNCQVYPVHVTTQLLPPYSVYLADYAAPGCEQLRVVLLQRDLTRPAYQTFLRMSIEWNGREIIRSLPSYRPSPLTVSPGVPTVISGSDLYHYLDPQSMDFIGYSRETYLRTKSLPEGQYRITFTAYDYARPEVAMSLPGSAYLYLAKAEPPLLNMPPNQYIQPVLPVQNIVFSWLPRNISSPNSVNSTEYLLELFEIRPAGYNPNEIVNSTRPVFSTQVSQPQYVYGIADPALMSGMRYAWRVRAVDTQGRDAIRNSGYSEVFTFAYGETGDAGDGSGNDDAGAGTVMPAVADGFKVEAEAPRRAKATWQASAAADGYRLTYRRTAPDSDDTEWKELETSRNYMEVNGLIPGSPYEARLQSRLGTRWGGYSSLVSFTMPEVQEINCGDPYTHPEQLSREPLEELKPYAEINAGGFPVTVLEATGSNGRFTGRGYVQMAMLGYVKLRVEFRNIFVNADHYLVEGDIPVVTDWENNAIRDADVLTEGGRGTGKPAGGTEQADITVDFEIPGEESIHRDEQGNIVVNIDDRQVVIYPAPGTDDPSTPETAGNVEPSPLGGDGGGAITVKDSGGSLYSVNTSTGQATYMGKASDNRPALFDKKTVASDRAVAVFAQAPKSKYAFDAYNTGYAESLLFSEKYEELRTSGSEAYQVPFKLIPAGATDVVQVTITPAEPEPGLEIKAINPDRIIFRTAKGAEYTGKPVANDKGRVTLELTLPAAEANDGYELYALHPVYAANTNGYEYDMLGKLTVVSYAVETPRLSLVAVNGNAIEKSAVKSYLDRVYLPVGVNWQVGETEFDYDMPRDSLDVTGSGMFSRYTPAMKRMNAAFMQHADYDPSTLYIFVLQRASLDNTSGDMPRGCQFGYIFTGAITDAAGSGMSKNEIIGRTVAHELGHGTFKLRHTFDSEYRIAKATTDNLMDYSWGTELVKHQWDAIHAPGLVIGLFEKDEDAMNVLAPTQFVVTYKDTNLQINDTLFVLNGFHQNIVLKTVKQIEKELITNKITWIVRGSEQKSDSLTIKMDDMKDDNLVIDVKTTAVLGKVYQASITLIKLKVDPEREIIRTLEELLDIEKSYNDIVSSIDQAVKKMEFDPFLIKGNNNRYVGRGMNRLFENPGDKKTDNIIDGLFSQLYATDLLMEIYEGNFEKMVEKIRTIIQKDPTGVYQTENKEFIQKVISQINEIQHKDMEQTEQLYQEAIRGITLKQLIEDE